MSDQRTTKQRAPKVSAATRSAIGAVRKAKRAAFKRLPFESEKRQNERLEFAVGTLAEAYRLGAEEAQTEILRRLDELERKLWTN